MPGPWEAEFRECEVPAGRAHLSAVFITPASGASAAVVLPLTGAGHRYAWQHRFVSLALRRAGMAVLLVELVTEDEDGGGREAAPQVTQLTERLSGALEWLGRRHGSTAQRVGSLALGAAGLAALQVAEAQPELLQALVCSAVGPGNRHASPLPAKTPTLVVSASPAATEGCALERLTTLSVSWLGPHLQLATGQ